MKKTVVRSLIAVFALMFVMTTLVSAQGLPGSGWYTTTTIQNIGAGETNVELSVYPQGSGNPSTASFSVPRDGNKLFIPGAGNNIPGVVDVNPSLGANFSGSAVASAGEPIAAIGSIANNPPAGIPGLGVQGGFASEFFRGASTAAQTLIYPAVKHNFAGKTTLFSVQAAGSDVNYTATIRTNDGVSHTRTGTIPANRSVFLLPGDFNPPVARTNCNEASIDTSPCFGALRVETSSGDGIAGTVVEYVEGASPATLVQAASLFPATEADSKVYCPAIKHTFTPAQGRSTGMTVANTNPAGGAAVNVRVTFSVALGANAGQTYNIQEQSIPAGGSFVFTQFTNTLGGMPAGNLASAVVETTDGSQSIVAVVNEQNFGTPGLATKATTYTCFGAQSATSSIAAPLVKKNLAGSTSGPTVQNVTESGSFAVQAAYVCNTGNQTISSPSLGPGESYTFFNPPQIADASNCAVTLTATGNIVAIVQETSDFASGQFAAALPLNTKNYEGINK